MKKPATRPAASLSRGMWIALAATLVLTAASYGVRAWREALHVSHLQESVVEAAPLAPAPTVASAASANSEAASSPAVEINPATGQPIVKPPPEKPAAVPPRPEKTALASFRATVPAASQDAMQSRRTPPALPVGASPPPPPPPAALPPPNFRIIGRYAEGDLTRIILAHNNTVLVAKRGDTLPDGFRLRAIRTDAIVVVRLVNKEKIEMPLGNP